MKGFLAFIGMLTLLAAAFAAGVIVSDQDIVHITKKGEPYTIPPNPPSNISPLDEATGISLTPTIQSSAFSDADVGDTHAASQWQITTIPGDYSSPVFDSDTDSSNLTSINVPSGMLGYSTTYYWRVAHQDNNGAWSSWSEETSFTTQSAAGAISDANTVLLDHFNGSTLANFASGDLAYVSGPPGLAQAADFTSGLYLRYDLPGWYTGGPDYNPGGKEGTVEMWVRLRQYPTDHLATLQWYNTTTPPGAGYIGGVKVNAEGKLESSAWMSITGHPPDPRLVGATTISLEQWTHIAWSWGPAGTKLYVNGVMDASSPENYYPSLNPTFYVYLNGWGGLGFGDIDELHISKVQRSDQEIQAHSSAQP